MAKKRKPKWRWMRYRKNDLAHNVQCAVQRWVHANKGTAIVMGGRCIVTTAGRRVGAAKYKARGTGVYFHDEVACGFGTCGVKCCSSCVIRCAGGEGDALIELDDVLHARLDREVCKVESGPGIPIQATACQAIAEAGAGGRNQVAHADDFT